jgi:hypothetical protein
MPSHWQFRHLQPKLWAKEGPGVKLAVWLPTTKSRELMPSRHPNRECNTALERSRRGYNFGLDLVAIQLWSWELWRFKVPGVPPGQNRDSISGVPGICAIWMPPPWRAAENTIGSKVVAYSQVRGVVSLVCPSARGKSQHQRVSRMLI